MSLGYAEKLSYRDDLGGQLGSAELCESAEVQNIKIQQLAQLVRESNRIVAFTGAGISTACGIPDFRGPQGIWTLQRAGKPIPKPTVTFAAAKPSLTHQALVGLEKIGKLSYVVSQNVDCLHLRSGIPPSKLAELHGNCFKERCPKCRTVYIRDFEMETVGLKATGRSCSKKRCRGKLRDHVLDWEDALPEEELQEAERQAKQADLAICLGTSLQITPACNIPLRTPKAGGKLVIVNLQKTPKDKKASLVIHAKADLVLQQVMGLLGYGIPAYTRTDRVLLQYSLRKESSKDPEHHNIIVTLCNTSGVPAARLPLVDRLKIKILQEGREIASGQSSHPPHRISASMKSYTGLAIASTLYLTDDADASCREVTLAQEVSENSDQLCSREHSFISQVVPAMTSVTVKAEDSSDCKRQKTSL